MKRLSPLPPKEQLARGNLLQAATEGFWWCKRCVRVVVIERRSDGQDDSRWFPVCAECFTTQVREYPAVLPG